MHDASGQFWGVVTSGGGTLGDAERTNLIHYVQDVRAAGFKQLTVVFGPMWTNDPIGFPENRYDSSLFDENWAFIRAVRPLVKQYGPEGCQNSVSPLGVNSGVLAALRRYAGSGRSGCASASALRNPSSHLTVRSFCVSRAH